MISRPSRARKELNVRIHFFDCVREEFTVVSIIVRVKYDHLVRLRIWDNIILHAEKNRLKVCASVRFAFRHD
jgi:hypothetical protein